MSGSQGFSYEHNNTYDLPGRERSSSAGSFSEPSGMTSHYGGTNRHDVIISHQPTTNGNHTNSSSNNSGSSNNITAPWTYVPSGSIPLQRQDFHSSMKSLNINGYSSMDNTTPTTPTPTTTTTPTPTTPDMTTTTPYDDAKRRVSSAMSAPPSPAPTTTVAASTPGTSAFGSRDWASDLFESFRECKKTKPVSTGLKKFFRDCVCVPCMMCDIAKSLGDKMCLPFIPGTGAAIRFKVRILGGIQGTIANDCLVTSCCCPCAVCQMYREIDDIGLATR